MASIDNVSINSSSLIKCYEKFYKDSTFTYINNKNYFHYLHLFGIRASSSDSSKTDDFLGAFRVTNFNVYDSIVAKASLDPSPTNLTRYFDAEARAKGGTAFIREGQHLFKYMGKNFKNFSGAASFCPVINYNAKPPITGAKVYRYLPEQALITAWQKNRKPPLSATFEQELAKLKSGQPSKVKLSESTDVCIHKAWRSDNLTNDSAGCSVSPDLDALNKIGDWAKEHIDKKFGNAFFYTVFTAEQFLDANKGSQRRIPFAPLPRPNTVPPWWQGISLPWL